MSTQSKAGLLAARVVAEVRHGRNVLLPMKGKPAKTAHMIHISITPRGASVEAVYHYGCVSMGVPALQTDGSWSAEALPYLEAWLRTLFMDAFVKQAVEVNVSCQKGWLAKAA